MSDPHLATGAKALAGLTAAVTGANRGIGRAITEALGAAGADVFLVDRDPANFADLQQTLQGWGRNTGAMEADVTRPESIGAALDAAAAQLGKLDLLVNAAGVYEARAFLDYTLEDWNRVQAVNVTGTMLACQAALRHMLPRRSGRIINISSAAGRTGASFRSAYSTSKHAVIGLTRCLAAEFVREGITVNAICPGMVDTEMFDAVVAQEAELTGEPDVGAMRARLLTRSLQGRMIDPDEIAQLAVYMASPAAKSLNGQAIALCGGMVMQ